MKIRYHYENENQGVIVLESEPQLRTLWVYSQHSKYIRLPFPYIYYIISYRINTDGIAGYNIRFRTTINKTFKYEYNGIYDRGLMLFLRNKPLEKFSEFLSFSPTDMERVGLVCTDHLIDRKRFSSISSLVNEVIGVWWQSQHVLNRKPCLIGMQKPTSYPTLSNINIVDWKNRKLEDICEFQWNKAFSLRNVLKFDGYNRDAYGYSNPLVIPKNATLIEKMI